MHKKSWLEDENKVDAPLLPPYKPCVWERVQKRSVPALFLLGEEKFKLLGVWFEKVGGMGARGREQERNRNDWEDKQKVLSQREPLII